MILANFELLLDVIIKLKGYITRAYLLHEKMETQNSMNKMGFKEGILDDEIDSQLDHLSLQFNSCVIDEKCNAITENFFMLWLFKKPRKDLQTHLTL